MSSDVRKGVGKSGAEPATKVETSPMGTIRNTAEYLVKEAKEVGANAGSYLQNNAETLTDTISGGLKATARTIREKGPQDGRLGDATSAVAQTFSNFANYLDGHRVTDITADLSHLIGKNPLPALLVGIGLGVLLGHASRSKS